MVVHDKFITAAGVSARIDMAIYLINELKGEKVAKAVQLAIEYDPKPIFNSGNFLEADEDIIRLSEKIMSAGAKKELSIWDMVLNTRALNKLNK